jgi:flagellar hook-associated protein 1 FlgK
MGLSTALDTARSGLTASGIRTALVADNIANAETDGFTKKTGDLTTTNTGGVEVSAVERSVDTMLQRLDRANISKLASESTIADGLTAYTDYLGQPDDEISPAAKLSNLSDSLITLASMPSEESAQIQVVSMAQDLSDGLNDLSDTLSGVSDEVEMNIRYDVASLNEALQSLATLNTSISGAVEGSAALATYEDKRDLLLDEVAGYMDIQILTDTNGMTNIYTGGGAELVIGNQVQSVSYDSGSGKLLAGDVDITPGQQIQGISEGSLSGLFALHDEIIPEMTAQLDSFAANLISSMQTANAFGTGGTGLFTDAGAAYDSSTSIIDGMASRISVNTEVVGSLGGDPNLLQTGGVATTASGDASYITSMLDILDDTVTIDTAGLGNDMTLSEMSATMTSSHQAVRANYELAVETTQSASDTIAASRLNFEGVNIDDEMQKLIIIEQSYAANAKVLSTISDMMDTLINAVT